MALNYITKSINILIYPYIFSYIQKEISNIEQYKTDLIRCDKNIKSIKKNKIIDDKTATLYKNNLLLYVLSVLLICIVFYQGLILLWRINISFSRYYLSHSIISILCIIAQLLAPAIILNYFYIDNDKISDSFESENLTKSIKNIKFWTYIFNISMIANIGYTLIYNMHFFINIEKRI